MELFLIGLAALICAAGLVFFLREKSGAPRKFALPEIVGQAIATMVAAMVMGGTALVVAGIAD